jgi:ATP-binding protein involved in chromosome partitioning
MANKSYLMVVMYSLVENYLSSLDFVVNYKISMNINNSVVYIEVPYLLSGDQVLFIKGNLESILKKETRNKIVVQISINILSHQSQGRKKSFKNIKNIIVVASGKGGVGKSTVSANLAVSLSINGARVGLLDADIYGPSQPKLMGSYCSPCSNDQQNIEPLRLHGVEVISIGNLIEKDAAVIWRGPMITAALMQMFERTNWNDLDYLIVDLPPGTGDIQLTLAKNIPIAGALIVTTPQDLAKLDAQRAITMFEKMNISILGIIENMSAYVCSKCGVEEEIFAGADNEKLIYEEKYNCLGEVPLSRTVAKSTNEGVPIVVKEGNSHIAKCYNDIALKFSQVLSCRPKCLDAKLPNVVVENLKGK